MLSLRKIAITGGVASGKTSVCRFFEELGAYVVNADAIVHELLTPDTDLGQQIIRQLGNEIIKNGQISRRIVAEKAFKDPATLKKLEELLHPAVLQKIEELYVSACRADRYSSFVVEIPLLFEIGADKFYDVAIAVLADEAIARKRFEQAGFPKTEYDLRMNRQLKPEKKAAKARYTIHNNGSMEELRREVIQLNQNIHKQ
ncbi:MAG TPA: dephospho-CoA kinase [Chlamydiales bacterium]|nr:dephospho-CoA kinase [Chlamydiales bacterium]